MALPLLALFLAATPVFPVAAADPPAPPPATVSYYKDVRPIFQQHCQGCHQPARAQGGYMLTEFALIGKPGEAGKPVVVPGNPEASYLIAEITVKDRKSEMPKNRPPLSDAQIKTVTEWVRQGAADDTPASARTAAIDADHPPTYRAAPVVPALVYSPDGELLAVAGYHEVLLHKADGSGIVGRLVGASERVQAVAFSPDGKRLAVSGGDPGRFGEVQIWDVAKRKLAVSIPVSFDT
ncbi:MAG: c-type cytochrome domain-containing protein, partial [Fimbriiglobus sp.]